MIFGRIKSLDAIFATAGHLRVDVGGGAKGRAGHDAEFLYRRVRLRGRRAMLRGTGVDGPGIRLCLYIHLCGDG